ncbi:Phenylalanine-tRNA ligase beta subunit [Croceitalea dokdonensis DOKDO 023]|uniref:Phenylalanine--tRNA ligase beta subunit n=1 Tax=Croceitalea dokdonensis DOKDO 023 TaxID=1300341 RepID=A0A0P7AJ47_9FLAO|nr:phenylalanine--tRNA ligase subunit beta [Croceitalea dokdonensis]KPM33632.1 Phenylalanine-tRNA ligase beta subunit [Croceitalea dokdonensis DOKDO 023]
MNISYNWLRQFITIDWPAEKTGELLTDLGLEVEGISEFESVKGRLQGVVVGHVQTCIQHPNADRLKLTTVDIGQGAPLQIVCGAPNVAAGQKVPVATVGTTLYAEDGQPWAIKKGKIRGEFSHGMICAEDELGLGKSHDGIMVLDDTLTPGTPLSEIYKVEKDQVFEIGLTPNRSDAMSHFGVARDLKAGLEQQEVSLKLITPSTSNFLIDNRSLKIDIEVDDYDLAPRYCGVTISKLIVQESPDWLKVRLQAIGLTPINNIVDVTNYVLHELGQPLHAFDAAKIKGSKVKVKTLPKGTKFVTLDGVERKLHEEDLMICDSDKPMCIAGVFGGEHSAVTENTTSIFLESAYFDPISIRKTAKRHGLNTDASFRFERGIDINLCEYALIRAAQLIKEIAGGEISSDVMDFYPNKKKDFQVFLTFDKINKLIGEEIPSDTIKSILASLEIKVNNVTESGLGLTIPSYRSDVQREVDVIEEILRVYGYNKIKFGSKFTASVAGTTTHENHKLQDTIGDFLVSRGFYEIMTNSLEAEKNLAALSEDHATKAVKMLNPLSQDLSVMRTSMLLSGMQAVAHNQNRRKQDLKLFEFGKTYVTKANGHGENAHLSLWVTGNKTKDHWLEKSIVAEFFFLKGVVSAILDRLGIHQRQEQAISSKEMSDGISITSKNRELVTIGMVSTGITSKFGIKTEVFFADMNWDNIQKSITKTAIVYQEVPKYPAVNRDLALLIHEDISYQDIEQLAYQTERKLLKEVNLFDVYRGNKLPEGKKSYAISLTFQDDRKTLTDKQVEKIMSKIQHQLTEKLGAELR